MRVIDSDVASLAARVAADDPDVVRVTDAPRWLRWRSRSARLARDAGLLVVGGAGPATGRLLLAPLRTHVVDVRQVAGDVVARVRVGDEEAEVSTRPGP